MASNLNLSKSNINRIQDTTLNPFVHNIYNELNVSLYPTPSSGYFTVEVRDHFKGDIEVKIFNLLGEEVKSMLMAGTRTKMTVDMSKESKGVYFIRITAAQKTTTQKIVIE